MIRDLINTHTDCRIKIKTCLLMDYVDTLICTQAIMQALAVLQSQGLTHSVSAPNPSLTLKFNFIISNMKEIHSYSPRYRREKWGERNSTLRKQPQSLVGWWKLSLSQGSLHFCLKQPTDWHQGAQGILEMILLSCFYTIPLTSQDITDSQFSILKWKVLF